MSSTNRTTSGCSGPISSLVSGSDLPSLAAAGILSISLDSDNNLRMIGSPRFSKSPGLAALPKIKVRFTTTMSSTSKANKPTRLSTVAKFLNASTMSSLTKESCLPGCFFSSFIALKATCAGEVVFCEVCSEERMPVLAAWECLASLQFVQMRTMTSLSSSNRSLPAASVLGAVTIGDT